VRGRDLVLATSLGAGALACGTAPGFAAAPLAKPPEMPTDQAKCKIAANQENPLVTEWPASEKANLEARLKEGSLVVAYGGCTLKLLSRCKARGSYRWRRTTTTTDTVEIHNADELYAKLPLGAVSLEGELERSGRLAVQTTVSGQFQLQDFDPNLPRGECEGATHVLGALSVGAFKLRSGGAAKVGAKASVKGIGSGGGTSSAEETLVREAGEANRCGEGDDGQPHFQCSSPIQMFLQPLPSTIADRGPEGTIKAKFLPVRGAEKWEVTVGDRTLCQTPCERWVDPAMPYTLKYDPGFFQRNEYIQVPDLRDHVAKRKVDIKAQPRSMAEFVGGIVATTFGGLAVATGTALTAAGCGKGGGACTGGLITLPLGAALTALGIYWIVDSAPTVQITPQGVETPQPAPANWTAPASSAPASTAPRSLEIL
jgi:hypothetical protein